MRIKDLLRKVQEGRTKNQEKELEGILEVIDVAARSGYNMVCVKIDYPRNVELLIIKKLNVRTDLFFKHHIVEW